MNNPIATTAIAPIAAPIPIPALVPVERPPFCTLSTITEAEVDELGVEVKDGVKELDRVDEAVGIESPNRAASV